jgi:hypothetical protein
MTHDSYKNNVEDIKPASKAIPADVGVTYFPYIHKIRRSHGHIILDTAVGKNRCNSINFLQQGSYLEADSRPSGEVFPTVAEHERSNGPSNTLHVLAPSLFYINFNIILPSVPFRFPT